MNEIYKSYLFDKHILLGKEAGDNALECVYSLANLFNIKIVKGAFLADLDMVRLASEKIGKDVPEPFYRGFPRSVLELDADERIFDQWVSYVRTYGFGNFDEALHSIMEHPVARKAFDEKTCIRDFEIVDETEALKIIDKEADNMLSGTRALSEADFAVLCATVKDGKKVEQCVSKNTAVKLLSELRQIELTRFLVLSDVFKLVDEINYSIYENKNPNKLNFKNKDRKFVTKVIRKLIFEGRCDLTTCYEKKKFWCGLLHHIHFDAKTEEEKEFVDAMRTKGNKSVNSAFEKCICDNDIVGAADIIKDKKGEGALLRNLTYLLSRCNSEEEVKNILDKIEGQNGIILLQLMLRFSTEHPIGERRTFKFARHNMTYVHTEDEKEANRRKSFVNSEYTDELLRVIKLKFAEQYNDRLGVVYIDEDMKNAALPISESTAQKGFETLCKGSRIHLPKLKKIRAFTYWEKVNDIDLSVIGLGDDGTQTEFSWRTMATMQSDAVVYSGDVTSGYNGGSEYFDVDVEAVKAIYPNIRYLIFCDNVFSQISFSKVICRAGYMLRDKEDSGEVFEPKTVKSSFPITADSTFAYLFAIDLKKEDFVWLNTARQGRITVAGTQSFDFLKPVFEMTEIMNVHKLAYLMASEITDDPAKADIVFSDKEVTLKEGAEQIRSFDTARLTALLERKA